ncbi:dienelactone hydrolase family protein [Microvirga sp. VF16]|uniref:dienelactone hydrolase family protein n=1 Tax=Microvirga sp. VF16 TaxID=2807101 RepID=UPI001FEF5405|nr:dienelactone hydrolase family protein [Microvirga sp. VF16]
MVFASHAWGQPVKPSDSATPVIAKVELDGAARPLGKFQEQRARQRGEDPKPTPGSRLQAYLAKPEGDGPFPAVVVLHGCRGVSALESQKLPELLTSWGYVALSVDSFTSRKAEDACVKEPASVDRVADAYGALSYLAAQPFVDRNRVGLLGVSMGARAVLAMAERQVSEGVVNPDNLTFKAGVAYYPRCGVLADKTMFPLLIMVGSEDQWTPARACEELVAGRASDSASVDLAIYPGAHHGFVEQDWVSGQGFKVGYNAQAAEDSLRRAHDFFDRALKR